MRYGPTAKAIASSVLLLCFVTYRAQKEPTLSAYQNAALSVEKRAADLLKRMTADEKAAMLSGANWMETVSIDRIGIPAIKMADGPMGVRAWYGPSALTNAAVTTLPKITATAFPVGMAMAATWNPDLVERQGSIIGREARALGRNMILAPTINIARIPLWGRNFECYGEDPYLAARMAVAYIKGSQGAGVIATAKHFAANNQEFERHRIDEMIDERTLHEIYFPAFKAAVQEAGVLSVMSAYNKVNGAYCAENSYLLDEVLRKQWGFKGFVVSDWGGTYSTTASLQAGLNLEMPGGRQMRDWLNTPRPKAEGNSGGWLASEKVLAALGTGHISQELIDERVRSILRVMFERGLFDRKPASIAIDETAASNLAHLAATESIVLLKNAGDMLPFETSKLKSLAVIGPNSSVPITGGGGSSQVRPRHAFAPLDGIRKIAGAHLQIAFAQGVPIAGETPDATPGAIENLVKKAAVIAAKTDAAIVIVGYSPALESEGFDRRSLDLPPGQDALIQAIVDANPKTVVVIQAGSPVSMAKWLARVPAVLQAWYGGQEGGNAIADVLFGKVNPSGKLPVSFPKKLTDSPAFPYYPGKNLRTDYREGIYVGYRHFDRKQIEPLFPFGFGLSYTKFEYSNLTISQPSAQNAAILVTLNIRNAGSRAGAEVVQVYVHDPESSTDRPIRELKAFRKVFLRAGESQKVVLSLDRSSLSFFSSEKHQWIVEPGLFEVQVGSSSRHIRLKQSFLYPGD
jgi:beta-glucosidase